MALPSGRAGRRRRVTAPSLVVLGLIGLPIVEVWLLIQVGHWIGVLPTVAILVAEAAVGAWLLRREGGRAYAALTGALRTGGLPTRELSDAALVLAGGILLVLPGLVTDLLGLVCLLPFTRGGPRRLVTYLVGRQMSRGSGVAPRWSEGDVIEGESVADPAARPAVVVREADDGRR